MTFHDRKIFTVSVLHNFEGFGILIFGVDFQILECLVRWKI